MYKNPVNNGRNNQPPSTGEPGGALTRKEVSKSTCEGGIMQVINFWISYLYLICLFL